MGSDMQGAGSLKLRRELIVPDSACRKGIKRRGGNRTRAGCVFCSRLILHGKLMDAVRSGCVIFT